jgi:dienelactone hydrolase
MPQQERVRRRIGAWGLVLGCALSPLPAVARQPLETFASLPLVSQVSLSPDGEQLAALMNVKGQTTLVVQSPGRKPQSILVTDNKQYHFRRVQWVNDERLVVSVRFAGRRGFVGTEETRLLSIKADGTGTVNLVQGSRVPGSMGAALPHQIQDRVIDWLPQDGRHVLLELVEPGGTVPAVYKVNVDTGRRTSVRSPERYVRQWMSDAQGRVRAGVRVDDDHYELRVRAPEGNEWRSLWRVDTLKDAVWPLGFGRDPQELFVQAYHQDRQAVFSVRLDDPALTRRLVASHPKHDVQGRLIRSPKTGEVLGLRLGGDEREAGEPRAELWNPAWRALLKAVDQGLPNRANWLLDISRDEERYLVYSSGDKQPGEYYVGNRRSGELALVGSTYPQLDPATLAGKSRVTIKARDGLALDAFLTLPLGRTIGDGGPALPMVLLPHGGPHSRDDGDFETWTEFLADRGYMVLQVNFRGSEGYGHEFETAGLKRWGLEMQDDLTDGVAWAVAQRLADPTRVCIVGASYGGYAALMGAVKTPRLFRCAVSFAGVSDLPDLIAHERDYIGGAEAAERMIGRVWGDRERLRATSPARQAEHIQVPVLLVHGSVDRVVPVEQSADMARAVKRAGKSYRYIEQDGGDHHLSRYEHRLEFFKALEAFLDDQLRAPVSQQAAGG